MLKFTNTKNFRKDLKKMEKRGKKRNKIDALISTIINEQQLNLKYKNHTLTGNYAGYLECHIDPDWLLIYKLEEDRVIFERTGTHSNLFN